VPIFRFFSKVARFAVPVIASFSLSTGFAAHQLGSDQDQAEALKGWKVQNMQAAASEIGIVNLGRRPWLRLKCDFGGSLTKGSAVGVLAENSESKETDVRVRVRLRQGFLAAATLRCNPERETGYAGGISSGDKLYITRMNQGRVKLLAKAALPESLKGTHQDCWIRFKAGRDRFQLKAWPVGRPEPDAWAVEVEDCRFDSGLAGLGVSCFSPKLGGQPTAEALFEHVRITRAGDETPPGHAAEPLPLGN